MICLSTATQKIQAVLAGTITTNQLPISVKYKDYTDTTYRIYSQFTNTNNTTDVDIVNAPEDGTRRELVALDIYNNDSVNATITIKLDDNGTEYILNKITLGPGERLEYNDGIGFKVFTSSGAVKSSQNQGSNTVSSALNVAVLSSDQTNNNSVANTIQDVTGLSFPVTSGNKYWFRFTIQYTVAATTTGSRWSINGPGGVMRYKSEYSLTATTNTVNEGVASHDLPAGSNATSASTGSNIAIIEGFYEASATGNVIARFASEVANSAIVAKTGSIVQSLQVV